MFIILYFESAPIISPWSCLYLFYLILSPNVPFILYTWIQTSCQVWLLNTGTYTNNYKPIISSVFDLLDSVRVFDSKISNVRCWGIMKLFTGHEKSGAKLKESNRSDNKSKYYQERQQIINIYPYMLVDRLYL